MSGKETAVLLSLHKQWWERMAAGEKSLEIRKTYPKRFEFSWRFRVLVYVTGGVGVCGEFTCKHIHKIRTIPEVQKTAGSKFSGELDVERESGLDGKQLAEYAGECGGPLWGWEVADVKVYDTPRPLQDYGVSRPPQSWRYIDVELKEDGNMYVVKPGGTADDPVIMIPGTPLGDHVRELLQAEREGRLVVLPNKQGDGERGKE